MEITNALRKAIIDYKNGEVSAFDTIYSESDKYIYVCIDNVLNGNDNKEDMIQDVMQDAYVEISKHLKSLEDNERFLSWAGTIATRKCYEIIKKNNKYVYLGEDENFDNLADRDDIIPEEVMQSKEKQRLVKEIINNELTEMQRLCVIGVYYNDMKQSDIAKELGIPENTVKSNIFRAKARIKDAVVELAEKKSTKLYSVAPFMLLLFVEEVKACTVPPAVTEVVVAAISTNTISVGGSASVTAIVTGSASAGVTEASAVSTGANAGATVVKPLGTAVKLGIKAKIAIIASAVVIGIGIIFGSIAIIKNFNSNEPVIGDKQYISNLESDSVSKENGTENVASKDETQKEDESATKKQEEATTKAEELDDGRKSIFVEAASKLIEKYNNEGISPNHWRIDVVAFNDYTLNGEPEFCILYIGASGNLSGKMYTYNNGEYSYYMDIYSYGEGVDNREDYVKIYKDKTTGKAMVTEMSCIANSDENNQNIYENYYYLVDIETKVRTQIAWSQSSYVFNPKERVHYKWGIDGPQTITEAEFNKIFSNIEANYTYVGTISEPEYASTYSIDDLNSAYSKYVANK